MGLQPLDDLWSWLSVKLWDLAQKPLQGGKCRESPFTVPTHSISPGTPRPPGWGWRPPWTNLLIPPSCISYSQQLFVAPLWYFRGAPLYIWQPQMNPFLHLYFQMKYKWNILFALVLRAWWIEGVTGRLLIDMFGIIPDSRTPQRYHHQNNQFSHHHHTSNLDKAG